MAEKTRVVIVGGGHNGLVAAGYLGRAGLNVQVLERRDVVGGAAVTEEWFPGYKISTCSYICHILQQKVIDDLELRRYGFHVYPIDPSRVHPFPNGKALTLWHDDEKTAEELRKLSPEDADAWLEWAELWHRAVRILSDYYLSTPPSLAELSERFRQEGEEELLETLLTVPLRDLINRYFVSDEVKAAVSTGAMDMGDISAPGSAYISALYRYSAFREDTENYGIVRGGMGSITQSLARSAEAAGVSIRTGAEVGRILTSNGRATGVELVDGELVDADIVLSNADPKRTFLKLMDGANLDEEFVDEVKALKTQSASAKFLCALSELPDFSGHLGSEYNPEHLAMISLCPTVEQCETSWNDAKNGRITDDTDNPGPDPLRVRQDGRTGGPSRAVDVGLFPAAPCPGRLLARDAAAVRRAAHRRGVQVRTQFQGGHNRLDTADPGGHRGAHRPHRWQHKASRHGPAADDVTSAPAGVVRLPDTGRGPVHVRRRDASWRRGDGRARTQCRPRCAGRPGPLNTRSVWRPDKDEVVVEHGAVATAHPIASRRSASTSS